MNMPIQEQAEVVNDTHLFLNDKYTELVGVHIAICLRHLYFPIICFHSKTSLQED